MDVIAGETWPFTVSVINPATDPTFNIEKGRNSAANVLSGRVPTANSRFVPVTTNLRFGNARTTRPTDWIILHAVESTETAPVRASVFVSGALVFPRDIVADAGPLPVILVALFAVPLPGDVPPRRSDRFRKNLRPFIHRVYTERGTESRSQVPPPETTYVRRLAVQRTVRRPCYI